MQEQIEFIIPDGYIKDEENTTDKKVVYKLKKDPPIAKNWEEVCGKMFPVNSKVLFTTSSGEIGSFVARGGVFEKNNVTSKAQGEKLMAINQLLTVAKYLNSLKCYPKEEFEPRALYIEEKNGTIETCRTKSDFVVFNTKEAALKAVEILGEDVIRLALTANNY